MNVKTANQRIKQASIAAIATATVMVGISFGCSRQPIVEPAGSATVMMDVEAPAGVVDSDAKTGKKRCASSIGAKAPFGSMEGGGISRSLMIRSTNNTLDACTAYPEIEEYAQMQDLDPFFVRAVIFTESGFDPNVYSVVMAPNQPLNKCPVSWGCFIPSIASYDAGYDFMEYPKTNPAPKIPLAQNYQSANPDWRIMGMGLMGSIEPPYTFWPASLRASKTDGQNYRFLKDAMGRGLLNTRMLELARGCNQDSFNPFDPKDSICVGTKKLALTLGVAEARVKSHHDMGWLGWEKGGDKDQALTAYFAYNLYVGGWGASGKCGLGDAIHCASYYYYQSNRWSDSVCGQNPVKGFCTSDGKADRTNCYGITDFPAAAACWHDKGLLPAGNGVWTMKAYFALRNVCGPIKGCE